MTYCVFTSWFVPVICRRPSRAAVTMGGHVQTLQMAGQLKQHCPSLSDEKNANESFSIVNFVYNPMPIRLAIIRWSVSKWFSPTSGGAFLVKHSPFVHRLRQRRKNEGERERAAGGLRRFTCDILVWPGGWATADGHFGALSLCDCERSELKKGKPWAQKYQITNRCQCSGHPLAFCCSPARTASDFFFFIVRWANNFCPLFSVAHPVLFFFPRRFAGKSESSHSAPDPSAAIMTVAADFAYVKYGPRRPNRGSGCARVNGVLAERR